MASYAAPHHITFKSEEHERIYYLCFSILESGTTTGDSPIDYEQYWNSQDEVGKAVFMECVLKRINNSLNFDPSWWNDFMRDRFASEMVVKANADLRNPQVKSRKQIVAEKYTCMLRSTNRTKPPTQPIPSPLLEWAIFRAALTKRRAAGFY